jgi:hypothetical protein
VAWDSVSILGYTNNPWPWSSICPFFQSIIRISSAHIVSGYIIFASHWVEISPCPDNILLRDRGIMILMAYMIVITVAASLYAVNIMENTPFVNDILLILSTAAITWGFHLAVLYYDNMRRSLC